VAEVEVRAAPNALGKVEHAVVKYDETASIYWAEGREIGVLRALPKQMEVVSLNVAGFVCLYFCLAIAWLCNLGCD
jgi:hypothetical protein